MSFDSSIVLIINQDIEFGTQILNNFHSVCSHYIEFAVSYAVQCILVDETFLFECGCVFVFVVSPFLYVDNNASLTLYLRWNTTKS